MPRHRSASTSARPDYQGSAGGQLTCDQDHTYGDEQKAFNDGKMDKFIESVGTGGGTSPFGAPCQAKQVMDYYDGNTVTGLWNYAQHFAMSDNSYDTTFGPSSPGAINLVSGDTGGVDMTHAVNNPSIATATSPNADLTADGQGGYSLTSDAQPYWDDCSTRDTVAMSGKNIGDELNTAGLSWAGSRAASGRASASPKRSPRPARASRPAPSLRASSRTRASRARSRTPPTRESATPCIPSAPRWGDRPMGLQG
jgi:hypothetical protein